MDIKMPDMDGIKLTHLVMKQHPLCNVIMLTLYDEYLNEAMEAGAKGYLIKDIKREELTEAIRQVHNGKLVISKSIKSRAEFEQLKNPDKKIEPSKNMSMFEETIQALATIAEMRDPYTAGHQRRVTQFAIAIAEEMGLSEDQISGLRLASLVHDIGKTRVPVEILTNPLKLSAAEWSIMKTHPLVGYDILKTIDFPQPIAMIVYQHHERLDGSGYPDGLSGDNIRLEAKILAVADVVEAMSSFRPYRPAIGLDKALLEVTEKKGILYDSKAVEACIQICSDENFKFA
jgi:putative nucleotidyltransferase with HDIG domain